MRTYSTGADAAGDTMVRNAAGLYVPRSRLLSGTAAQRDASVALDGDYWRATDVEGGSPWGRIAGAWLQLAAGLVHGARHAPGGPDSLSPYFSGRYLTKIDTNVTFTFDGTGGQAASTFSDVTGMTTPSFTVTDKPIAVIAYANYGLINGTTKFTGMINTFINALCTASPLAGDVGKEGVRANRVRSIPTASLTHSGIGNVSQTIWSDYLYNFRVFNIGNGGLDAGEVQAGTYQFKMQFTTTSLTGVAGTYTAKVLPPSASTVPPACLILILEC